MGRGTPCQNYVLLRHVCSLALLLAPGAFSTAASTEHRGHLQHRGLRGDRGDPSVGAEAVEIVEDGADTATEDTEQAAVQAEGAGLSATEMAIREAKDAARLVASEEDKLSAHFTGKAKAMMPQSLAGDDGVTDYMISSFPELRCINYVRMPDLVWRPLVNTGLGNPTSIVVDETRNRLYIADTAQAKIFWYQLIVLPGGQLVSDGRQHVAVQMMVPRQLTLDLEGNLWFSGKSAPVPPAVSVDGIWKQSLMTIDQSSSTGKPIDAAQIWTSMNTGSTVSSLVLDAFNIYYGNDLDGKTKGSIVKASKTVPLSNPSSGLSAMADNADTTYSVAVTPTALFYGADNAIYGVLKTKVGGACGATGDLCQLITDAVKKPTAMIWNGDGTVYVADNGGGAIYAFASGSVSPHALEKVLDAGEVYGLDIYKVNTNQKEGEETGWLSWLR